eukprot:13515085-Alexandrium_andersonii.AAC.1
MCIRDRCFARAGKRPIGGRWVGHKKGDAETPNVRSRCVAKDIAFKEDSMFAAIPRWRPCGYCCRTWRPGAVTTPTVGGVGSERPC